MKKPKRLRKTIIRIEHKNDGYGLWRAGGTGCEYINKSSFIDSLIDKHRAFPTPFNDNLSMTEDHFCAFKSIEQLKEWLEEEWIKEILSMNYRIWQIKVKNWQEGEHQIIFKKKDIIKKRDISHKF